MDVESLISSHVRGLEAYEPPDWGAVAARSGVAVEDLIRLDANENPYGLAPGVRQALANYDGSSYYPDYWALQEQVAAYAGLESENVVLGNGGDEIIDLAVRLFVEPGEGVIVCPPAFGMYAVSTRAHRCNLLRAPRRHDFSLDLDAIEALSEGGWGVRPKLLFVTSPGNPDGLVIPRADLERLMAVPLIIVVDEAYIEFGGETVTPMLADCPNLIVVRTFSKWAGMAGLRLGYALASPQVAAAMARLRPPYNVNGAAVAAALATFEDMDSVQAIIGSIVAERQRLESVLATLPGIEPLPSQANFVFCWLEGRTGKQLAADLADRGILVRAFSKNGLTDAVRIGVGRPEQNDALLQALGEILGVEDMEISPAASEADASADDADAQVSRRFGSIERRTKETKVSVAVDLDGSGVYETDTGLGFLDHMLAQVASHGLFDLRVYAWGDLVVDEHHTVEDVAIGLGQALDEALGDRRGLVRMGQAFAPLDEALAHVVVDLSGRPYAVIDVEFANPKIGAMDSDLIIHFLESLAIHARLSLHARVLYGRNDHHKAEALFKALGRALDGATRFDPRRHGIPSTKGVL